MSTIDEDSDALWLFWQNTILEAQVAGHPIRKIMLPQTAMTSKAAEAMLKMQELVEIEAFYVDWPTPFQRESE
ncbi:hypothetical protein FIBSPDRAFT_859707 [Athelia psychrophila]|uniref:Uncharacterized protein n=1 Tax=Athelia psychrophila TaxID=1759441 RepID=A0A166KZ51_9AGAM|nr:hypothetical protein FIBSPDRAFT_859707 [Fibularhizoctonia sp. CBS 109695]